jgi:hypothetical protein
VNTTPAHPDNHATSGPGDAGAPADRPDRVGAAPEPSGATLGFDDADLAFETGAGFDDTDASGAEPPPAPVVWAALSADEAEYQWLALNEWVEDARQVYAIPSQIIPPFWHRHRLLVEHLSALRTHWLAAHHPDQNGSAPFGWLRDLDEWKLRMREAVATLGARVDADRPHRLAPWPGQPAPEPGDQPPPANLDDRYDDFVNQVMWDVERRRAREERFYQMISQDQPDPGSNGATPGVA